MRVSIYGRCRVESPLKNYPDIVEFLKTISYDLQIYPDFLEIKIESEKLNALIADLLSYTFEFGLGIYKPMIIVHLLTFDVCILEIYDGARE